MNLIFSILLLLFCVSCVSNQSKTDKRKPNIIIILSDDIGFSDIGCYGGEINTPNLNSLAENGLRFTQFYNTGRCMPTRASLLTGVYQHQTGIGCVMQDFGTRGYKGDLVKEVVTIAEVLKDSGYKTYLSGKWHLTPYRAKLETPPKDNWPLQRGFDRFYGTIHGAGSFYDPNSLVRGNDYISPHNDPEYKPTQYYYTHAITDHAVKYIREHQEDKPFFMYVSYTAAHWPMHALENDIKKYKGRYSTGYEAIRKKRIKRMKELGILPDYWKIPKNTKPWNEVENKAWEERCMEVYAAMIDSMDQGIGKITQQLKKQGQLDNTLILYLQDNGACAELRGRKSSKPIKSIISKTDFQTEMVPPVTRENKAVLMGQDVMPGGPDSYIAYGQDWASVSNTPFRLWKQFVHEGGIASPLIAHWPKGIKHKNQWRKTPTHLIDIMATCIDVAEAEYPEVNKGHKIIPLEGESLIPVFENDTLKNRNLYFEHGGNRAVRAGKWKLTTSGGRKYVKWELYDIENDRTEMNDLSKIMPEKTQELIEIWYKWANRTYVLPVVNRKKKK